MIVPQKLFIPQQEFALIPSFSVTPIQLLLGVHSTLELLPVGWDAIFSTFVRMCTFQIQKPWSLVWE